MLILAEQPGVASQSFATPGYKSVALRAMLISRHISFVDTYPDGTINIRIVEKQQGYCSGGYARVVERSEKFDSIEKQQE